MVLWTRSLTPTKQCKRCDYVGDRFKGPGRSTSDGYDHICKDCVLEDRRQLRYHKTDVVARWKKIKGCCECGYNKHHAALHLDHIDPETKHKKGSPRAYDSGWSMSRIKEELSKCRVLCANCHGINTHEQNVRGGNRRY